MYADRVEAVGNRSVKERLNVNSGDDSTRRRPIAGKRQRQDDKWEHDLYDNDARKMSSQKVGAQDLRLKLQRKSQLSHGGRGSLSGVRDLREKLSGIMNSQPRNTIPPKPKPVQESAKPVRKSVAVEASPSETKKAYNSSRKKQKADTSVDDFLLSLDLEKYSITFQAEEVDMAALVHMTDEDLRALGIPMGPRKKILLALESRS